MKLKDKIKKLLIAWLGVDKGPDLDGLIKLGMKVGKNIGVDASCSFDNSHCWLITIGDNVTFGPRTMVLAHDASTKKALGYTKLGPVTFCDGCFIGAGSVVMPGVTVGKNSIVGAYSVVTHDVPADSVYCGSPAKFVCTVKEYLDKQEKLLKELPVFDESYTLAGGITEEKKARMLKELNGGRGFIV